jgi:uncharacterized membrane protein YfcA
MSPLADWGPLGGLGLLVGAVLALTGAGGGALAVPLLVLALGWSIHLAAPVALVAVGLSSLLGAAFALREGIVRYRAAMVLGAAGMVAAPLGVALAQRLPQGVLLLAFVLFMLFTARRMWRDGPTAAGRDKAPACVRPEGEQRLHWTRPCLWVMLRVGAMAGVLSGLLGIGGGFVIVPALDRHSNLDLRSIQATSLAVIALVSVSGLTAAWWSGQLQPAAAAPFAVGAVAGLLLGRRWAMRLSTRALRRGFAVVAVVVAVMLLLRTLSHL